MAITFVAAGTADKDSSGSTSVPGLPAGLQFGDLLWAQGSNWFGNAVATMVSPWLRVVENSPSSGSTLQGFFAWRWGSDPASTTMTWDEAEVRIGAICAFRGVKRGGMPFAAIGSNSTGSDSSIEHSGVTTPVDDCAILLANTSDAETSRTLVTDYTSVFEDEDVGTQNSITHGASGDTTSLSLMWRTIAAGATGTVTVTQSSAANWASAMLALLPEPAARATVNFRQEFIGTNSLSITDVQEGDAIDIICFRDGSNSEPGDISGATGFTKAESAAGNSSSFNYWTRIVGAGETSFSLSSANATTMLARVYRPESGYTLSWGDTAQSGGTGTTIDYAALADSDSGIILLAGCHRAVNGTYWSPPSGFMNRAYALDATDVCWGHESYDPATTQNAITGQAVGGSSSGWRTVTARLIATAAPSGGLVYRDAADDAANATTYNGAAFDGFDIGPESDDRVVLATIGSRANAGNRSVSSVAFGAGAGVRLKTATITDGSTYTEVLEVWRLKVTSGTTLDIHPTFNGEMLRCSIIVHTLTGTGGLAIPYDEDDDTAASSESPLAMAIDAPAGGSVFAAGWFQSAAGAGSMVGVTEDAERNPESTSNTLIAGSLNTEDALTAEVIEIASSTNFNGDSTALAISFPGANIIPVVRHHLRQQGIA